MDISDTVRFMLILPPEVLFKMNCKHDNWPAVEANQDTCLACNITIECRDADFEWGHSTELVEGRMQRVVRGSYQRTNKGSMALSRLLAFAQGHPDPLTLLPMQPPTRQGDTDELHART